MARTSASRRWCSTTSESVPHKRTRAGNIRPSFFRECKGLAAFACIIASAHYHSTAPLQSARALPALASPGALVGPLGDTGGDLENEAWTPLDLLKRTADYFAKHGVEEPRLDAELLLAKALGVERIMLYAGFERVITPREVSAFREFVRERARGRPAKYIIGQTEFFSLPFKVDARVLIPRPETELLVERCLAILADRVLEEFPLVVELGTGSGAIIVSLAKSFPDAAYVATDVAAGALEVARANAQANGVGEKIEFLAGDLFDPLATMGLEGKLDVLVSNPPYVAEAGWAKLPREIRDFEPKAALVAGPRGTEVHERILEGATIFVRSGGVLLMEMDNGQREALAASVARFSEYGAPRFHQDYARLWRVMEVQRL